MTSQLVIFNAFSSFFLLNQLIKHLAEAEVIVWIVRLYEEIIHEFLTLNGGISMKGAM